MKKPPFGSALLVALLLLALGACSKTYTEPELKAMERKQDMNEGAEEARDAELAAEGGADAEEDADNDEEIERETEQ